MPAEAMAAAVAAAVVVVLLDTLAIFVEATVGSAAFAGGFSHLVVGLFSGSVVALVAEAYRGLAPRDDP
jgi:hypothetical protein